MKTLSIAVPHVSFESVKKTIIGLYAFKKPGTAKKIKGLSGINQTNTSKALSIAQGLNLVQSTKTRGEYDLTENGRKFGRLLSFEREKDASKFLREVIMNSSDWDEIVAFLRASIGSTRDYLDLVFHVESRLDKNWTPRMRKYLASNYKSFLAFAGFIDSEEEKLVVKLKLDDFAEDAASVQDSSEVDKQNLEMILQKAQSDFVTLSLPDLFILHVRNTRRAFNHIKKQVVSDSYIGKWIDLALESLEE